MCSEHNNEIVIFVVDDRTGREIPMTWERNNIVSEGVAPSEVIISEAVVPNTILRSETIGIAEMYSDCELKNMCIVNKTRKRTRNPQNYSRNKAKNNYAFGVEYETGRGSKGCKIV